MGFCVSLRARGASFLRRIDQSEHPAIVAVIAIAPAAVRRPDSTIVGYLLHPVVEKHTVVFIAVYRESDR